jgi:hypothetical protein
MAALPRDRTLTAYASSGGNEPGSVVVAAGVARSDGVGFDFAVPGRELAEVGPSDLARLIDRLDEVAVLPFDRFSDVLVQVDRSSPAVLGALRLAGVIRGGDARFDDELGDGYRSSLVLDGGRLHALVGSETPLSGSVDVMELTRYVSHIVLGTHPDGTRARLFIGAP